MATPIGTEEPDGDRAHFHRGLWILHWDEATAEQRQQLDEYIDWVETLPDEERATAMKGPGFYIGQEFGQAIVDKMHDLGSLNKGLRLNYDHRN